MPDNSPRHDVAADVHTAAVGKALIGLLTIPAAHVARYLRLVDEGLAEMPDDATRRAKLQAERAHQERLYSAYVEKIDRGLPTDPRVTAWDYVETINALDQRLGRYSEAA